MSTLSSGNVTNGNLLLKERTHTINNRIQLHILGVPPNKLGNWLIKAQERQTDLDTRGFLASSVVQLHTTTHH